MRKEERVVWWGRMNQELKFSFSDISVTVADMSGVQTTSTFSLAFAPNARIPIGIDLGNFPRSTVTLPSKTRQLTRMARKPQNRRSRKHPASVKEVMTIAQSQTKFSQPEHAVVVQEDCLKFLHSLPDSSVDVIVTDPAYSGMNQKLKFGNGRIVGQYQKEGNGKWFKEFHDTEENYRAFLSECTRVLKDDCAIYIMFDSYSLLSLGNLVREYFDVKNIIVWDKVNMGMGHNFRRRHEFIIYATKGKTKLSSRGIPDVWQIKRVLRGKYPTQKPVEVFENMLKASAKAGDVVCDPFVGSGSSAIAALRNNCYFIGSDVCPDACKITRDRVQFFLKEGYDKFQESIKGHQQRSLHGF